MVKRATSLFNSFCINVDRFSLPILLYLTKQGTGPFVLFYLFFFRRPRPGPGSAMVKKRNGRATSLILNKARMQWLCRATPEEGYTSTPTSPKTRTWPPGNAPRPTGHPSNRVCYDCYKVTSPTIQRRPRFLRTCLRTRDQIRNFVQKTYSALSSVIYWKSLTLSATATLAPFSSRRDTIPVCFFCVALRRGVSPSCNGKEKNRDL